MKNLLSDHELLLSLKKGDESAFSEIYHRYKGVLYQHAYRKLNDDQEADDVIHELFTSLWSNRASLSIHSNLGGYLYVAIRNRVLDKIAHQKVKDRFTDSFSAFLATGYVNTDYKARENQLKAIIEKEVDSLPSKMKEIFLLSRAEHLTHKEIAERLALSEKTVKNQINNALKVLRKKLGPHLCALLSTIF